MKAGMLIPILMVARGASLCFICVRVHSAILLLAMPMADFFHGIHYSFSTVVKMVVDKAIDETDLFET